MKSKLIITLILLASTFAIADDRKCLDPYKKEDEALIKMLLNKLSEKIFNQLIADGKADYAGADKEALKFDASDLASDLINNSFICKELPNQFNI